jgi:hypothetical protein
MNVDFQGRGLPIPTALADHARRRLDSVLMHRSEFVQRVVVRLGGANNRRGPSDTYCLMQVHMSDALAAAVVDIGPDINDVIDRATHRVGRMVAEHIEQTRAVTSRRSRPAPKAPPRQESRARCRGARLSA